MASRRIVGVCNYSCLIVKAWSYCKSLVTNEADSGIQTYRRSVQLFLSYCKSLGPNEVDSGIQMYRWNVQLLTFNILVLL